MSLTSHSYLWLALLAILGMSATAHAQTVTSEVTTTVERSDDKVAVALDPSADTAASVQLEAKVSAGLTQQVTVNSRPNDPIRANFLATDADGNGSIDRNEAAADTGLTAQFDRFDADGDGRLSIAEYKAWRDWR